MSKYKGKVQKNIHGVNVLVETTNSTNRNSSNSNKSVVISNILSDLEVLNIWKNRNIDLDKELEIAKRWIRKQDTYAVSSCKDETINISHSSIVEFK